MTQALEATMLVCFGLSWPINLVKNIKAGTAKSMSLKFILLIIFGYVAGITAKLITGQLTYVLIVYILNILVVSLNLAVYFVNKHKDKVRERNGIEAVAVEQIVDNKMLDINTKESIETDMFTPTGKVDFYKAMNK